MLKNVPANDIRLRYWERLYPGCSEQFGEVFGTQCPKPSDVAEWKNTWRESTPYFVKIAMKPQAYVDNSQIKLDINEVCQSLGIHPYFWDYYKEVWSEADETGSNFFTYVSPRVSFYFEEHAVMFKLGWDNE